MSSRTVVVLDVPPTQAAGDRGPAETVQGTGLAVEEVDSLDGFAAALRAKRARVGVIAFEALWPDPQRTLRALRDNTPGARIVVAYVEGSPRLRLGQRLWSVGLCDYFLARSIPPHELTPILRQSYADAMIEASLDTGGAEDDPATARLYNRISFLQKVNA